MRTARDKTLEAPLLIPALAAGQHPRRRHATRFTGRACLFQTSHQRDLIMALRLDERLIKAPTRKARDGRQGGGRHRALWAIERVDPTPQWPDR